MGFRTKAMVVVGEGCLLLLCSLISLIDKKCASKMFCLGHLEVISLVVLSSLDFLSKQYIYICTKLMCLQLRILKYFYYFLMCIFWSLMNTRALIIYPYKSLLCLLKWYALLKVSDSTCLFVQKEWYEDRTVVISLNKTLPPLHC